MKITSLKNTFNNKVTFTSLKINEDSISQVRKVINCGLGDFFDTLTDTVKGKMPDRFYKAGELDIIKGNNHIEDLVEGFYELIKSPLDILDAIAKKFPNSKLNNSELLKNHREYKLLDLQKNALEGLYDNVLQFIGKRNVPKGTCGPVCKDICNDVVNKTNKLFMESMTKTQGDYDTKIERFWTRLVTGFTAAAFMGKDFYNKAISKGNDEKIAKKEERKKQKQEIIENLIEAFSQYAMLASFSKFTNSKIWAAPVLGAVIGLVARILSRFMSHTPLTRLEEMKKPDIPNLESFIEEIKEDKANQKEEKSQVQNKKPLLSLKNVLLALGASIAIGFGLKFGKMQLAKTNIGKELFETVGKYKNKLEGKLSEKIYATQDEMNELIEILKANGEEAFSKQLRTQSQDILNRKHKYFIGIEDKTTKLFGKIEVKNRQLLELPLLPFKMLLRVVSYPYLMANKLYTALRKTNSQDIKNIKQKFPDIKNLYLQYKDFKAKYPNFDELNQKFGEYIKNHRLMSLDTKSTSKIENAKVGVMAQVFGTMTGMYFNMTDEYNNTIRSGGTKDEASKDARLRGLNKFFRMSVQAVISSYLNTTFKIQYATSIFYAQIINFISTILTDTASRQLTGMPVQRINTPEEYKEYQKNHKEGPMAWYYNMIDKLAS